MSKEKKSIAVIGLKGLPALGGTATAGQSLIHELKDSYQFTVYSIKSHVSEQGGKPDITQKVFRNFPFRKLNVFYYYWASAFHALFLAKYDLIHLHLIDGAFILPLLRLKYKVISTSHGRPQEVEKWGKGVQILFRLNERLFLRLSNMITCVSAPLIEIYRGMTKKRIHYISNGIHIVDFERIPLPETIPSGYIIFAAGRIIPLKGCHVLLESLHKINYKGKLVVVGDTNQIPSYTETIRKLSEGLDVTFAGLLREKEKLFSFVKGASLFVFPSFREAMSIMLLEAASMRVPILCSDIPHNKAVFSENEVVFFDSGNSDSLADKLSWAFDHPEEMKQRTQSSYKKLVNEYRWSDIALKYASLYEELLETK